MAQVAATCTTLLCDISDTLISMSEHVPDKVDRAIVARLRLRRRAQLRTPRLVNVSCVAEALRARNGLRPLLDIELNEDVLDVRLQRLRRYAQLACDLLV